jgi:hypothetical protein
MSLWCSESQSLQKHPPHSTDSPAFQSTFVPFPVRLCWEAFGASESQCAICRGGGKERKGKSCSEPMLKRVCWMDILESPHGTGQEKGTSTHTMLSMSEWFYSGDKVQQVWQLGCRAVKFTLLWGQQEALVFWQWPASGPAMTGSRARVWLSLLEIKRKGLGKVPLSCFCL